METQPLDPQVESDLNLLGQQIIAGLSDLQIPSQLMEALIDRDPRLMDENQRAVLIESMRRNRKEVLERKRTGKRAPRKQKSDTEKNALRDSISLENLTLDI